MTTLTLNPLPVMIARIQRLYSLLVERIHSVEDMIVAFALAAMMMMPIMEMILRALLEVGIDNVNSLIQHMTLVVGTIGAAVATREKKLLAFAGTKFLSSNTAKYANLFSNTVAAIICAVLFMASIGFIEAERSASLVLAYGIPVWVMQIVIPIAYASITIRLLKDTEFSVISASITALIIAAVTLVTMYAPVSHLVIRLVMLVVMLCAALLGAPIFVVVAGAALILLWTADIPLASMIIDQYSLVSNHLLPSIPLFTLVGVFLAESKAPQRLIELFNAWFGQVRGGPAIATVSVATFFTCFTGASGVTILALGGLLMPLLMNAGYSENRSLGLITGGGSAGVLLMPALPLILYAIVANVSIEEMFLGGLMPALLMLTIAAAWGIHIQPVSKEKKIAPFNKSRAIRAIWNAKWELFLPVVLLTGMFSGLMTTLEASALTAFYTFIVEVLIHRELSLRKDVPRVLLQCGLLVGGILMILGVALGLTNYMVDAQISDHAVEWVKGSIENPLIFLLTLNVFLLIVGFFVDIFSAIIVVAPLIVPLGLAFGIHPVHLGILFLANMELGYLTPPVGMNLFFASLRFERSLIVVCRSVIPLFCILAIGVLIITYVPWLSTGLLFLLH